ncbi:MAG: polysaccharide deacetylase family protein [Armatimonadota bacterium]
MSFKQIKHNNNFITAIISIIISFSLCSVCFSQDYISEVSKAIRSLEIGKTQEALDMIEEAYKYDANHPLAHCVAGFALLFGGRAQSAENYFSKAINIDNTNSISLYGKALALLQIGQLENASNAINKAESIDSNIKQSNLNSYIKSIKNKSFQHSDYTEGDIQSAVYAYSLMNNGKYSEALAIWDKLSKTNARSNFGEKIGITANIDYSNPLSFTGWPVKKTFLPFFLKTGNKNVVSGNVILRADTQKAWDVKIVTFQVNNRLAGITNRKPFQFDWDTTRESNGVHTIKITGSDERGSVITESSMVVVVENENNNQFIEKYPSASKLWDELWKIVQIEPSSASVNYNLAICAQKVGDNKKAIEALEKVLSANPNYKDASQRILSLIGGTSRTITKAGNGDKIAILTFDDGPKQSTNELLEVLKQKNVKATFFVVGTQIVKFPEILKKIADEGHDIQNHTYSHRNMKFLSEEDITMEVFRNCALVRDLTGKEMRFLRPPGGHEGSKLPEVMKKYRINTVLWTVNCSKVEGTNKEKIYNYVVSSAEPGVIYLMHNVEYVTLQALPDIIDTLRNNGYRFTTISDVYGNKN